MQRARRADSRVPRRQEWAWSKTEVRSLEEVREQKKGTEELITSDPFAAFAVIGYRNRAARSVSTADSAAWRSEVRPPASEALVTELASASRRRASAALSTAGAG